MRHAREEKLEIQKLWNRGVTKSTATFIGYDFEADKKLKQSMWRKKWVKSFAGTHHLKATESSNRKKNQKSMCQQELEKAMDHRMYEPEKRLKDLSPV